MPDNLYDRVKLLETEMNRIIRVTSEKKDEQPNQSRQLVSQPKLIFLENINGLFQTVSNVPTHTPRNFREQIVLVDSGSITKMYVRFGNSWRLQRFYNT